jgi:hypothetical protein
MVKKLLQQRRAPAKLHVISSVKVAARLNWSRETLPV